MERSMFLALFLENALNEMQFSFYKLDKVRMTYLSCRIIS